MDALAFLALGPRRGRVAVPLAVATLAAAGWAGIEAEVANDTHSAPMAASVLRVPGVIAGCSVSKLW